MNITIPNFSLVVLIGPSGCGKSTFAKRHFLPTEIISSDSCRGLAADDENDQTITPHAFEILHFLMGKRLELGRLTVVDATNVQPESRKPLTEIARRYHCLPVAIVFKIPEKICQERNRERSDRDFGPHVIRNQLSQMKKSLSRLKKEGFRQVVYLDSPEEVDAVQINRVPLWNDKRTEHGPFDFIGDVHGCCDELETLLQELGYQAVQDQSKDPLWGILNYAHPEGRKAVFVGDLVDRGPRILDTLCLVRNMVVGGSALCVPGNHDVKLLRKLWGKNVKLTHGLAETVAEINALPNDIREPFCKEAATFLDGLVSHYVLDDGKVVVAHAGLKQDMQGRASGRVREFALYGETTGETDEFGLPVRHNWAAEYRGNAMVVYGHTPVPEPEWLNRTINIDTGCVFGGRLTALRYPEQELVSVEAQQVYCEPIKPFLPADDHGDLTGQQLHDDLLDAEDVLGKQFVSTRLRSTVTIREGNATAALEVMSRFAADPKWLIYLPPTMSPSETSQREGFLEHPAEAFSHYRGQGVPKVVCQQKHMGSRAVVIVCRDAEAARCRFGVRDQSGIIYTRTGRRFFSDVELETALLERLRNALTAADVWSQFETEWVCLDCELMPWSAKAQELLRTQYAAVGAAGRVSTNAAVSMLERAAARLDGEERTSISNLLARVSQRKESIERFVTAYRQYCWPVESIADLKLAPFHFLATEGKLYTDKDHVWHMETVADVCRHDAEILLTTEYKIVDLLDPESQQTGIDWWTHLTSQGGEGMVVKPLEFIVRGKKGLVQPAVKCRGQEYLRIIYGPDYTFSQNLERLRKRGLSTKRSLALREFALGIEGLERFLRKEPLRRVHECVFGVLALESEPVDPRL